MVTRFKAIYEGGLLRPIEPYDLEEGATYELVQSGQAEATDDFSPCDSNSKSPAELLAEIAALPMQGKGPIFSGWEHDRILYGEGYGR